jgi:hypothetical protein
MRKPLILGALVCFFAVSAHPQAPQTESQQPARQFMLSSGNSVSLAPAWVEREQVRLTPPSRLAESAPLLVLSEIHAFDNYADHSVLVLAASNNPFLGRDARFLDTRMHAPLGSGSALTDYLFYFFFPPPRSCIAGASETFESRAHDLDTDDSDHKENPRDFDISYDCIFTPTLPDFYSSEISRSLHVSRSGGKTHWEGYLQQFYLPPMVQIDSNGMTFYVFEAQGQSPLSLAKVNHFNLPDDLQGAQVDFFWAIGAPSPFPFLRDPTRKNVPLIHVAYAGLGFGPNKRLDFLSILRTVSAPQP